MRSRLKLTMGLVVALAACSRVGTVPPAPTEGTAAPPAVMTASSLAGVATLAGRRLRVTVFMETGDGEGGTAHLEIPDLPLTADGSASWRGETLELDLRYDGDCPGDLRIRAERTDDGERLEGMLTAKDCTGEESGKVVLEVATRPSEGAAAPRTR